MLPFYKSFTVIHMPLSKYSVFKTKHYRKCSKHLNLIYKLSQTYPHNGQFVSLPIQERGHLGADCLVISLCLTGISPDWQETNVFRSASTSPQPCHRCPLVKRCFSANVTPIASFMSTSGLSQELAVFRDPPMESQRMLGEQKPNKISLSL